MSQIERKWIQDSAVNNEKIDAADTYDVNGLRVDSTSAAGGIGIGTDSPLDALHMRRTDTSAGLRIHLDDGASGRAYRVYTEATGLLNIHDLNAGLDRITVQGEYGRVGINTTAPTDTMHIQSTSSMASLQLDLNDGVSGRAYQFASDSTGNLILRDLDAGITRLTVDSTGAFHFTNDATVGGNFEVNGTVVVINTEIVVADQLEINQVQNQPALIASQDNVAATATVVRIENAGSGDALTIDSGNVGVGTTNPVVKLHLADPTTGSIIRLTDLDSGIGGGTVVGKIEFEQRDSNSPGVSVLLEAVQESGLGETGFAISTGAGGSAARRVRVNEVGYVGIGTQDPLSILHFEGDLLGKVTGSASNIGNTGRRIGTIYMASAIDYSSDLDFNSSGTRVTMTTTGGMGIGTTTPAGRLEILNASGGLTASNYLQITGSIADDLNHPGVILKGGNVANNYATIQTAGGGLALGIKPGYNSSSYQNYPVLALNAANSSAGAKVIIANEALSEKICFTTDGRIGIGSTIPVNDLDIASGQINTSNAAGFGFYNGAAGQVIRASGAQIGGVYGATIPANGMNISGQVGIGTGVTAAPLHVWPATDTSVPNIGIGQTSAFQADLHIWSPQFTGKTGKNQFLLDANLSGGTPFRIRTNNDDNSTFMVVDLIGQVGINTASPSAQFHVNGGALFHDNGYLPITAIGPTGGEVVVTIDVAGTASTDHPRLSLCRNGSEEIRLRTYISGGLRNELVAVSDRLLLGGHNAQQLSLSSSGADVFGNFSTQSGGSIYSSSSITASTTLSVTQTGYFGQGVGIGTTPPGFASLYLEGNLRGASGNTTNIGDTGGTANGRINAIAMAGGTLGSGIEIFDITNGLYFYDYSGFQTHFRVKNKGIQIGRYYHEFSFHLSVAASGGTQDFTFQTGYTPFVYGECEIIMGGQVGSVIITFGGMHAGPFGLDFNTGGATIGSDNIIEGVRTVFALPTFVGGTGTAIFATAPPPPFPGPYWFTIRLNSLTRNTYDGSIVFKFYTNCDIWV